MAIRPPRWVSATLAVAYFAALLVPNLILVYLSAEPYGTATRTIAPSLALITIVLAISGRIWIAVLLTLPFALLLPVELFYILKYRAPLDSQVVGAVIESNVSEASAFMAGLWTPLWSSMLAAAMAWTLALASAKSSRLAWKGRTRAWIGAGAIATAGIIFFQFPADPMDPGGSALNEPREVNLPGRLAQFEGSFPSGLFLRLGDYYEARRIQATLRAEDNVAGFGARQSGLVAERQVYVYVIGETGRRDRWQIGGYSRPTTPLLESTPNVVWFTDMVTPWALTRLSVPVMLTRKPASDRSFGSKGLSMISAFREAGFKTYWLSNQAPFGRHDSPISAIAHEADERAFLNVAALSQQGSYDGVLVAPIEAILRRHEPRQLLVVHTLGSHFPFSARYPAPYERFTPSPRDGQGESINDRSQAQQLNNAYDNSIVYTDAVISQIIAALQSAGGVSALLYSADHGEVLYDGACPMIGHGSAARLNFEVAAFAWYSKRYSELFAVNVQALRENARKRTSTENLFATMLGMAGIVFPGDDASRNLFSPLFSEKPRMVNAIGFVDFDRSARGGSCDMLMPGIGARADNSPGR